MANTYYKTTNQNDFLLSCNKVSEQYSPFSILLQH